MAKLLFQFFFVKKKHDNIKPLRYSLILNCSFESKIFSLYLINTFERKNVEMLLFINNNFIYGSLIEKSTNSR